MRKLQIVFAWQLQYLNSLRAFIFALLYKPVAYCPNYLKLLLPILFLAIKVELTRAQSIPQGYNNIIQTNIFIVGKIQQWTLSLETKAKNQKQTNNFIVGFNRFYGINETGRKGIYGMYERKFYSTPVFDNLCIFISPYAKIIHREVQENGDWFIRSRDFKSTSIAVGGSMGLQSTIFKRMSVGFSIGPGIGIVLQQKSTGYNNYANKAHLDGQVWVQVGYVF